MTMELTTDYTVTFISRWRTVSPVDGRRCRVHQQQVE